MHLLGARGWSPLDGILFDRRVCFAEQYRCMKLRAILLDLWRKETT